MLGISRARLIDRMDIGQKAPSDISGMNPLTIFAGTTGDDTQSGSSNADTFNYEQGGNDHLGGGGGADTFFLGAAFTLDDRINGGNGDDALVLDGDYWGNPPEMAANTIQSIETIQLMAGNDYVLRFNEGNVAAGATLHIDATALVGNNISIQAAQETDGNLVVDCGLGINSVQVNGSADIITGNNGNDFTFFGQNFTPACQVDGVEGNDQVILTGDFSAGLVFGPDTMRNIDSLVLTVGLSYNITLNDANIAAGDTLFVQAGSIGTGTLIFDGSAETDGHFVFQSDDPGNDQLTAGQLSDTIAITAGGDDTVSGRAGDDTINAGAALTAGDAISGDAGNDTLQIAGDYSAGLALASSTLHSIETFVLGAGFDYALVENDGNVAANRTLTVDGSALGSGNLFNFNGSGEHDGRFVVTGGAGGDTMRGGDRSDVLAGGGGRDVLIGGLGADALDGGTGRDRFKFAGAGESTSTVHDTITGFETGSDFFILSSVVKVIDAAVTHGALSNVSFDSNLAAAIGTGQMGSRHAVLFTPDSGDLSGHVFLIVDANGHAGYQAGRDYVFEITDGVGLNTLSTGDFLKG